MASIGLPALDVQNFLQKICVILLDGLKIIKKKINELVLSQNVMSDKFEKCPVCHKQMLSHDLAQVNQCMKDFIKKLCGKTFFDT